jgi:tetrahydromethanopterin:alpha-L-glutamate ligase
MKRVAIALQSLDWHARALQKALLAQDLEPVFISLRTARFTPSGIALPPLQGLPDAVLVRAIAGGSFEEVTRRLGILHGLGELGVLVWNDARAIERATDKSQTAFLLAKAALPTPETWTVEGLEAAREVLENNPGPFVLKPLFGAQGRGLMRIAQAEELPPPSSVAGVYHLQRYIPPGPQGFCDHRLFVCKGEVIAAMTRRHAQWITNLFRGGTPLPLTPSEELAALARKAAAVVGADYAGVDIIADPQGKLWILEVNSMPGWRGLQSVSKVSIAERLAGALAAALRGQSA